MYRLDVAGGQLVEEQVLNTAAKAGPRHMCFWVASDLKLPQRLLERCGCRILPDSILKGFGFIPKALRLSSQRQVCAAWLQGDVKVRAPLTNPRVRFITSLRWVSFSLTMDHLYNKRDMWFHCSSVWLHHVRAMVRHEL